MTHPEPADVNATANVNAPANVPMHANANEPVHVHVPAPELLPVLRDVRAPELPVSIVDLGLVYAVRRSGGRVEVDLTFTATGCPCMGFITDDVRARLLREPGVEAVEVRVVWDPPWTRDRLTPEAVAVLRRYGIAA